MADEVVLTVDIGGTETKFATFTQQFSVADEVVSIPTVLNDQAQFLAGLYAQIEVVRQRHKLKGIAGSCPGLIHDDFVENGGSVRSVDHLALGELLAKRYQVPTTVNNDAQCALKAETVSGALADTQDGVVITLGTGVGGSIWCNGHALASRTHTMAGEFSYMIHSIEDDGSFTRVGKQGSATIMVADINRHYGNVENLLDGEAAFKHIASGYGYQRFHQYCRAIAALIINVQAVLDVPRFAIGGGIIGDERTLAAIQTAFSKIVNDDIMYRTLHLPEIVACRYKNYAGRVGAQLFWEELKEG